MIKTRFAPSPTGFLHIGNARAALINFLFTQRHGGHFMLRIDDTDQERSKKIYETQIIEDLQWLGMTFDSFARQSSRFDRYEEVKAQLIDKGRLYPCYETPQELDFKRKRQLAKGQPPIYDRGALKLTLEEKRLYEEEKRVPHWRFYLDHNDIVWDDLIRGPVHFHGKDLSDPVLVRGDGVFLYSLCSVIDDVDFGITHIIRGEDHVTNTASQIQLFEACSALETRAHDNTVCIPTFAHTTLLLDKDGHGLSKRLGSLGLKDMRATHLEPMAINSLLARLGTSQGIKACLTLDDLVQDFDLGSFSRTAPRFDDHDLWLLNHHLYQIMDFPMVEERLKDLGLEQINTSLWGILRHNINCLEDLKPWINILFGEELEQPEILTMEAIEPSFWLIAIDTLPPGPWDPDDIKLWGIWTTKIKEQTEKKGRSLFMPLRQALTKLDHGPEMKYILPRIGRDQTLKRLKACLETA